MPRRARHTAAERTRAYRIRKKQSSGETLTDEDVRFLEEYDNAGFLDERVPSDKPPETVAHSQSVPAPTMVSETEVSEQPRSHNVAAKSGPISELPDPHNRSLQLRPPIDFSKPQPPPMGACNDPNCVACRAPPKKMCPVNNTPIYPKPTAEASEFYAGALLALVSGLIQMRTGVPVSPPTEEETKKAGKMLAEVQWRRFGWSTGFDDIAGLLGTATAYTYKRIDETKKGAKQ